jgi:hypothetical protein
MMIMIGSLQDFKQARLFWIQSQQLVLLPKVEILTFTFLSGFTLLVTSWTSALKRAHCVDTVSSLAYPWNGLAFINICKKKTF